MSLSRATLAADQAVAAAASTAVDGQDTLEQVIVTGTRRAERTVLESNVPIAFLHQPL